MGKLRRRAVRQRQTRPLKILYVLLVASVAVGASFWLSRMYSSQPSSTPLEDARSALIVDQLSLTYPNETFVRTVTSALEIAGYSVDYYSGERITVDFYRSLAEHRHAIIILRVHSTAVSGGGERFPVSLFTSERYDTSRYFLDQAANRLALASYTEEERKNGVSYFGITPSFVAESMTGQFAHTMILMMGCDGMRNSAMASAFISKGASVDIGWNNPVSPDRTDYATMLLLSHIVRGVPIKDALQTTIDSIGPDPVYNSDLAYYPPSAGGLLLSTVTSSQVT